MRRWISLIALLSLMLTLLTACANEADRLYRRAKDAAEEGDYELALELVEQTIALEPERGRFHRRQGDWLQSLGRTEEALAAYDRATAAPDPSGSAPLRAIALRLDLGRLDEAADQINRTADVVVDSDDAEDLTLLHQRLEELRSAEATTP